MNQKYFVYAGLLLIALVTAACGPKAPAEPTSTPTSLPPTEKPPPTATAQATIPVEVTKVEEVPMGFTDQGAPYRGNPDAPVTLLEYSDFQLPYCGRHTQQTAPLLYEAYIVTGKVKHVFLEFPLDSIHPKARPAAEAALCAAKQGAEAFWSMHDRLFEAVSEWSGLEDPTEQFKKYAAELALETEAFATCLKSKETAAQVQTELEQGIAAGVSGVPAFFVNDWPISGAQPFSVFQETIEAALRGEHPPPTPTPLPSGVSYFDPNPERPDYTYGGDAFRGSGEAPIILIVFIDFQSSENRKHVLEEWPTFEKKYVEPGKLRLVIKHFPASEHAAAFKAAEAAECAGQQAAFWPMYDLLFQQQEEWSQASDAAAAFKGYAGQLHLDEEAFAACLDKDQTADKVKQDSNIATRNQFPPAPQFFIFKGDRGGYVPRDQLQEAIEQLSAE